MTVETRVVTIYWAMHSGKKFAAALSEADAQRYLGGHCTYRDDPRGWTIEPSSENVPVARGELVSRPARRLALGSSGEVVTVGQAVDIPHIDWPCPHCARRHTSALQDLTVANATPAPSPQIWHCERGRGIVLVEW